MTILGDLAASGAGITVLAISLASLFIGLAAWAIAVGRRTDAALDNAFAARGSRAGQPGLSLHSSRPTR
jgi:hypothetical protein